MKIEIDTSALQVMAEPGIGWIRVFGRGFTWKDTRRHPLVFSERNGYWRRLKIGPWSFRWLGDSNLTVAARPDLLGEIKRYDASLEPQPDGAWSPRRLSGAAGESEQLTLNGLRELLADEAVTRCLAAREADPRYLRGTGRQLAQEKR